MEISAADSPTRRSSASSSPEFEFWRLRNPPQFNQQLPLLSADELFAGGILLPLRILSLNPSPNSSLPPPPPHPPVPVDTCPPPPSKKWKDIFKPGEKKHAAEKKDKKTFAVAGAAAAASTIAAAEINIHIWPFSRSRSAGNNRPRFISSTSSRKTSSAPCSRCNSHGESSKNAADGTAAPAGPAAARKWAPNPSRAGGRIYLGRSNPVWHLRRRNTAGEKQGIVPSAGKGRTIKLNVNTCIAHQTPASCRDCEKDGKAVLHDCSGSVDGGGSAEGGAGGELNGSLFNLRAMFTRKVS
ncbi:hypothetical protein KSP40_PGU022321 [Platanthera guangdongensis]|uniref:Uncharacterized protein n=1 Tax=Platanthera guangdongensis TaxID=2320717 RepID=A0ABR2MF36_9ASPA